MTGGRDSAAALALRPRLVAQTYRITGVWADAEESVDEALARLAAHDGTVDDAGSWLAVVAARVALDRLRRRRRESYVGEWLPEPVDTDPLPDDVVADADGLRMALLVAYEALPAHERAALVLREGFELPYGEIGAALGASPATARQWVRRARTRLAGDGGPVASADPATVEALVGAVLGGDLGAVTRLLAEDVRVVSDGGGRVNAALRDIVGPRRCAYFLVKSAAAQGVELAATRVNGEDALAIRARGIVRVLQLGTRGGLVARAFFHSNPDKLRRIPLPEGWH